MEFMGVGLPELLVILIITLLVVGPNRLPEVAAQIARAMREFRRYSSGLTRDVTEALEEYIQRRRQMQITELFGAVEYDEGYDYKEQRRRE